MPDLITIFTPYLPPPLRDLSWVAHPLDGKLLLFERDSGLNILLEGAETAHLHRVAPRTLLIGVTNACNLTCSFCYRDLQARSAWRYDSLLTFCQAAAEWGVLEVAFGGGEPLLFPDWADFIRELYATTRLGINFTTNGTMLTEPFLQTIVGQYGQIRLSLYEDNNWPDSLALLQRANARFGVNWLITPAELVTIEQTFDRLLSLGVRDLLLLSYKGDSQPELHLSDEECQRLATFVTDVHQRLGKAVQLKLDVCWGTRLPAVPRLFDADDCGAGDDFISISSDKQIKPCSFAHHGVLIETLDDVRTYWQQQRHLRQAAHIGGCARLPDYGLTLKGTSDENIHLATVRQQP
jgi:MoaA/NifB/PqqE/SkfB family radical SAM enzyme